MGMKVQPPPPPLLLLFLFVTPSAVTYFGGSFALRQSLHSMAFAAPEAQEAHDDRMQRLQ